MQEQGKVILERLMKDETDQAHKIRSLPGPEATTKCYEQLAKSYDPNKGGFGKAPKFPKPGEKIIHS